MRLTRDVRLNTLLEFCKTPTQLIVLLGVYKEILIMWCSNSAVVLFTNDNWAPKVRFEKVKLNTMSFLAVVLKKVKVKVLLTTTRVPFLTRCVMLILRI